MTTTDFQQRFPKPWRFEIAQVGFSLKAANGTTIAYLNLSCSHPGIPQNEWHRHMAAGMSEHIPVTEGAKPASPAIR